MSPGVAPDLQEGSQIPPGNLLLALRQAGRQAGAVAVAADSPLHHKCICSSHTRKPRRNLKVHLALHFKPSALLVVLQPLGDGSR